MEKLCIFVGITIGGIAGSVLAEAFGMDMISLGNFFISGFGSVLGVYAGWKLAQKLK